MEDRRLYRGKRVDNKEWVQGGCCEIPSPPQVFGELPPSQLYIFRENPNTIADWGMPRQMCLIEVEAATVGQCTSLKDKHGKLIFEGDILHDNFRDEVVSVWWDENRVCFDCRGGKVSPTNVGAVAGLAEIIGNIHDTPEEDGCGGNA